jgi:hypothetical protein
MVYKTKRYILVGRKKGTNNKFDNMGFYVFDKKSKFGSLARLKKDNPTYDLQIVEE